jgi:hypothetical protein
MMTFGYGSRSQGEALALLARYGIHYVIDVRSVPWSRYRPEFSQDHLAASLRTHGVRYVFMGSELGGRPDDPSCYDGDGRVDAARRSRSPREVAESVSRFGAAPPPQRSVRRAREASAAPGSAARSSRGRARSAIVPDRIRRPHQTGRPAAVEHGRPTSASSSPFEGLSPGTAPSTAGSTCFAAITRGAANSTELAVIGINQDDGPNGEELRSAATPRGSAASGSRSRLSSLLEQCGSEAGRCWLPPFGVPNPMQPIGGMLYLPPSGCKEILS